MAADDDGAGPGGEVALELGVLGVIRSVIAGCAVGTSTSPLPT
jgi:hypothetical protein